MLPSPGVVWNERWRTGSRHTPSKAIVDTLEGAHFKRNQKTGPHGFAFAAQWRGTVVSGNWRARICLHRRFKSDSDSTSMMWW